MRIMLRQRRTRKPAQQNTSMPLAQTTRNSPAPMSFNLTSHTTVSKAKPEHQATSPRAERSNTERRQLSQCALKRKATLRATSPRAERSQTQSGNKSRSAPSNAKRHYERPHLAQSALKGLTVILVQAVAKLPAALVDPDADKVVLVHAARPVHREQPVDHARNLEKGTDMNEWTRHPRTKVRRKCCSDRNHA